MFIAEMSVRDNAKDLMVVKGFGHEVSLFLSSGVLVSKYWFTMAKLDTYLGFVLAVLLNLI